MSDPSKPNIVWITIDSVRADHTSMDGYHRDTTPNLRAIADSPRGQHFEHCFATGIGTPHSTASILTGTYPSRHGLKFDNDVIPERLATVPELLKERGYHTAGISRNSYLSAGTGLDRGFERFEWLAASTVLSAVDPWTLLKYLRNIRRHSAGLTVNTAKHATPFLVNELAKRWLEDLRDEEPFFFYLHYNEPHRPYYPPLPYMDRYADEVDVSARQAANISMDIHENLFEIVADEYILSAEETAALVAMYDAEIAYTDAQIGRLVDHIRSLELDNTVVVVTADHGELLGERGLLSHRFVLDDAVTNVPLVVHGFDGISHQQDELVQHVDLMRTLLDDAGAATDQFQGIDLRTETREYAIMQRKARDFSAYLERNPAFDASRFHGPLLTGLRTHDFRYEKSEERAELFELPDEETDVSDRYPGVVEHLDAELTEWLETEGSPIDSGGESALTESMRRQLRDLGYRE